MIDNLQIKNKLPEFYKLETDTWIISAATATGKRENNEDYYNVFVHPNNSILLTIADGVGGEEYGENASRYVTERLGMFFLEKEDLNTHDLKQELDNINEEILQLYNIGMATLTAAFIKDKDIIFVNIGDSRGYTYKNKHLKGQTKDQSEVWHLYEKGIISKDDLRFVCGNNIITNALGDFIYKNPQIITIPNDVDGILLTTDGITDILSSATLENIINKSEDAILDIVKQALYGDDLIPNDDIYENLLNTYYYPKEEVKRGKDNATAILCLKKNLTTKK